MKRALSRAHRQDDILPELILAENDRLLLLGFHHLRFNYIKRGSSFSMHIEWNFI